MSDNLKLRAEIGRLLGYTAREVKQGPHSYFWLYDSTGFDVSSHGRDTVDRAWQDAPHWDTDIGAAMSLLNDPRIASFNIYPPKVCVRAKNPQAAPEFQYFGCVAVASWVSFDALPLAICLAWIEAVSGEPWKGDADAS